MEGEGEREGKKGMEKGWCYTPTVPMPLHCPPIRPVFRPRGKYLELYSFEHGELIKDYHMFSSNCI